MIELETLQFGNFRSFVEDQEVSFVNREKLIQVDGKNENTQGSSGSGKTSLILALLYLLDVCDLPTTVLQSRLTKDGLWAIGKFKFDGVPVTISRSKKDGLKIEMPNETVSGNSKLAEEKLEQLIGLPKKIFKKMIHKKQKEGGFFLSMTPKEMYEFLIEVLGLQSRITEMETIAAKVDADTKSIDGLLREAELIKSSLWDMERILSEKKQPTPTIHPDELGRINKQIVDLRSQIETIKNETKSKVDLITKPMDETADTSALNEQIAALVPARAELNKKLEGIDASKSTLEKAIAAVPFAIKAAQKAGEEIAKIRSEKEHMEKSQCPTCMQVWVGDTLQAKIANADLNIQNFIKEALEQKKIIDQKSVHEESLVRLLQIRQGVNDELAALQDRRSKLDAEKYKLMEAVSAKNQAAKNAYTAEKEQVESQSRGTIEELNKQLKTLEIDLSAKESQINAYNQAAAQYEKEITSLNDVIAKKQQQIAEIEEKTATAKKKILIGQEAKRMIKAYVLTTFQETLDAIGVAATNILAGVPNMATSTIYFEGCKETKSGSIKDEIVAIINMDGTNEIPIKSLSGGEETTTHLAVDLAVIDVIESKVSKGANFIFMDEPFDGLDSVCKENCLEILKTLDTNKKIIMVDHSSELKEMVSDVILVVKKGETSTIAS